MKWCFFLLVIALFSCEPADENEIQPKVENADSMKVLSKVELRTSYDHIEYDTFIYSDSRLEYVVFNNGPNLNSEKKFFYNENTIEKVAIIDGKPEEDYLLQLVYDENTTLLKVTSIDFIQSFKYQDELPVSSTGSFNFEYKFDSFGNLIQATANTSFGVYQFLYEYDDKKNPYQFFPDYKADFFYFSNNNPTEIQTYLDGELERQDTYLYEYDDDGYPIKAIDDGKDTTLFFYTYILKNKN